MPLNVSPLPIIALATSDKSFTFTALFFILSIEVPVNTLLTLLVVAPLSLGVVESIPLAIFLICLLPKSNPASLNVNLVATPPLVFPNVNSI